MEALRNYLMRLVAAALLTAIASAVTPEGSVKKVVTLAGGLIMTIVLLGPLLTVDFEDISLSIAKIQLEYNEAVSGIEVESREIQAQIISEQAESYILTKAEELGISVEVTVETQQDGSYPYPWAVTVTGEATQEQKEALITYIEANLAVPRDRLTWNPG